MNALADLYRSLDPAVTRAYVSPRIIPASATNPYIRLLYADMGGSGIEVVSLHPLSIMHILRRLSGEHSVFHQHWVEFSDMRGIPIILWKLLLMALYRICGGKILWTVHNIDSHARYALGANRILQRCTARLAQRLHVHNSSAISIMAAHFGISEDRFSVVPHPVYPVDKISRGESRTALEKRGILLSDNKPVFLAYGLIGRYKGTEGIVAACIQNKLQLIVAGRIDRHDPAYAAHIADMAKNNADVTICAEFIDDHTEALLFGACDCAVFNFQEILTSGSVVLAQSYGIDMIVPNKGSCIDITGPTVSHFQSEADLPEALRMYMQNHRASR